MANTFDNLDNQLIKYKFVKDGAYLKDFSVETLEVPYVTTVKDPQLGSLSWRLVYPRTQYKFRQTVGIPFTDPESYKDSSRTPPTAYSALTLTSNSSISFFALPDSMGTNPQWSNTIYTSYTAVSQWMIKEHKCTEITQGAWEVEILLEAFSDYIWDMANAYRVAVPGNSQQAGLVSDRDST